MKKKYISLFLALVMIIGLAVPTTLAAESSLYNDIMATGHVVEFESAYTLASDDEKNALTAQEITGIYNFLNDFYIDSSATTLLAKRDSLNAAILALPNAPALCAECGTLGGHTGECALAPTPEPTQEPTPTPEASEPTPTPEVDVTPEPIPTATPEPDEEGDGSVNTCNCTPTHDESCASLAEIPGECNCIVTHDEECAITLLEKSTTELYNNIMAAETLADILALMRDAANIPALDNMDDERVLDIAEHVENVYDVTEEEDKDDLEVELMEMLMIRFPMAFGLPQTFVAPNPEYIYLDLSAGSITNDGSNNVSGYRYDGGESPKPVNAIIDTKYIYIYQSNGDKDTGIINGQLVLPSHEDVKVGGASWGEYVTNNHGVEGVISTWNTAAASAGRESTPNRISFTGVTGTYKLILDNVWCGYQTQYPISQNRQDGGITFIPASGNAGWMQIQLIGHNRFGNIHYDSDGRGVHNVPVEEVDKGNTLTISDYDGDSTVGTLTVANLRSGAADNYLGAAIGGSDGFDTSYGIIINSGIIYAGTNNHDNATAIGGGGNGYGHVTINGGTVTAVASSSGTAIGGGIGTTGYGGAGEVVINGGSVYAYNYGPYEFDIYDYTGSGIPSYKAYPTAIGGGSSYLRYGSPIANVTIHGGYVYAECVGGAAIGGGGSATTIGGDTVVTITGGTVVALSKEGIWEARNEQIPAGVGIGGGTGKLSGGSAVVNISGNPVIKTGSIGGGKAFDAGAPIGSAQVDISGGTIHGQVIMDSTNLAAGDKCYFKMTGGTIDNGNHVNGAAHDGESAACPFTFLQENGAAVYINGKGTSTEPIAQMSGGTIKNCKANLGGAIYIENEGSMHMSGGTIAGSSAKTGGAVYLDGGDFTMSGGTIGGTTEVDANTAENGGGVFVTGGSVTMTGGTITGNSATVSGGGVALDGGDFTMISGNLSNNKAVNSGGGAYASGGNIIVGLADCDGSGHSHSVAGTYSTLAHPTVTNNEAIFGGGLAVMSTTKSCKVYLYCGEITNNKSMNDGTGKNVFMSGNGDVDENTGSQIQHHLDSTQIGDKDNHGIVVIGGLLNVVTAEDRQEIMIKYHPNYTGNTTPWVGIAPENYRLNLPYCPNDWETAQNGKGLTFIGWTHKNNETDDVSALNYIRDKSGYKYLGDPITVWTLQKLAEKNKNHIDFYAVWAYTDNPLTYVAAYDNYGSVADTTGTLVIDGAPTKYTYDSDPTVITDKLVIPAPVVAGYTFLGWKLTADQDYISNWSSDGTDAHPNSTYMLDPGSGTDRAGNSWSYDAENTLTINMDRNFGHLTLTAMFKENSVTFTYEAVGPEGKAYGELNPSLSGKIFKYEETIGAATGTATPVTAEPAYGYKFEGWYTDADCKTDVGDGLLSGEGEFKPTIQPKKNADGIYESGTFYALFDYHLADLYIIKTATGSHADEQVYIFKVYEVVPGSGNTTTDQYLTTITIHNGGTTVINDLKIGTTYKVVEDIAWSWRHDPDAQSKTIEIVPNAEDPDINILSFTNTQNRDDWLTDDDSVLNIFGMADT